MEGLPVHSRVSLAARLLCSLMPVALAFLPLGCTAGVSTPVVEEPIDGSPEDEEAFAKANNAFAVDVYSQVRAREGNLAFSPLSLSAATAMVYEGARGETAAQVERVSHFTSKERTSRGFAQLRWSLFGSRRRPYVLNMANGLWSQKRNPLDKSYVNTLTSMYGASLAEVNFAGAPEKARLAINRWAAKQTAGKIEAVFPAGAITSDTRLVLANALYFNGRWEHVFEKSQTKDASFYTAPGKSVDVPMMYQKFGSARYYENEALQLLVIPYRYDTMYMVVVLPKAVDGLAALEGSLTIDSLQSWIDAVSPREVELYLPRWKSESAFDLSKDLIALGMPLAFDGTQADLSGMTGKKGLFLSAVLQSVFIDVSEKGTEAASVVAFAVLAADWYAPPTGPAVFRADHPFLYLIMFKGKPILFMGRVANPAQ